MTWFGHDLSKVIEQIPIGVAVTLPHGAIEYANPHLRQWLGVSAERILGANLAQFRSGIDAFPERIVRKMLLTGESWQGETEFRAGTDEIRHALELACPLHDNSGHITHFIHFLQDIGALKLTQVLNKLAFYDNLTGLPNRNLFVDRLSRAMAAAQRNRDSLALLYIDIDHFKRINDAFGHDAGDELLRQLALRLQTCLRKTDTVARLGGDEFVIILEQIADASLAIGTVENLLETCCGDYELRGRSQRVTLSIGISLYPHDAKDMDALLKCADTAMYTVKASGRNGFHLSEPAPKKQYGVA
ncbi:MAG: sensor domain-containing diguanylate cyclase [Burkholderiales bacterium]|nr:sensor domain-containing diguanylate cyclase [Burkholderiales bacterium]